MCPGPSGKSRGHLHFHFRSAEERRFPAYGRARSASSLSVPFTPPNTPQLLCGIGNNDSSFRFLTIIAGKSAGMRTGPFTLLAVSIDARPHHEEQWISLVLRSIKCGPYSSRKFGRPKRLIQQHGFPDGFLDCRRIRVTTDEENF